MYKETKKVLSKNKHKSIDKFNNIITIDGPAGSGKSTVSKILARELGLKYIDTGAMYRAVTLLAIESNIDYEDEKTILEKAKRVKLEIDENSKDESRYTTVKIDGRDVTDAIRSKEVGAAVSIVSKLSGIRRYLVKLQRKMASDGKAILEGRDTGSVVCPNAIVKIFLTASVEERVIRRDRQLKSKGQHLDSKLIREEIISRDKIDSSRKDSPLVIPDGGIVVDTTGMTIREVVDKIKNIYLEKIKKKEC